MTLSGKIIRELRRLIRLGHWNNRARFLIAALIAKIKPLSKHRKLDALLTKVANEPHGVILVLYCPAGMPKDVQFLQEQGCSVAQVENTGYDFESYRDGVLTVLDSQLQIQKLTIMNDILGVSDFLRF